MPIGSDQIPASGLTGGEGQVGEKFQGLTAVTRMVGVEEERDCGGVSTANRGGRLKRPLIRGDLNVIYKSVPGG
jgi:hypothetical protein